MFRPVPLLLFILLLILTGFYGFLVLSPKGKDTTSRTNQPVLTSPSQVSVLDPIRGNSSASVTIIEYGDFLCEACRDVEPALRELLTSSADVRLVWRDFPIETIHPFAKRTASAARCAQDQGKFWEYHDLLLTLTDPPLDPDLLQIATTLELDSTAFTSCLQNGTREPVVNRFQEEALSLGARSVPTFFINGSRYDGLLTADALTQAVDRTRQ